MNPGIVLISLTITEPSFVTKVSTRLNPAPSTALNALIAVLRTSSSVSCGSLAGTST